ncbi:MAG TPA: hypothetical protein VJ890_18880 [Vineibacter sp.]|nr:hypothetical protein [Vineibacter sp.]
MMALITGTIGILLLAGFLGFMVWWIKAVPLIVICASVLALMIYDFVVTMKGANGG